jgi:tricorn protease
LEKLLRQAWFYWQPRVGDAEWNMQYAFRGYMVVLCDQETASDGEAFFRTKLLQDRMHSSKPRWTC